MLLSRKWPWPYPYQSSSLYIALLTFYRDMATKQHLAKSQVTKDKLLLHVLDARFVATFSKLRTLLGQKSKISTTSRYLQKHIIFCFVFSVFAQNPNRAPLSRQI